MITKIFFCPVNGWDCPYFKENGTCAMVDEGFNPVEECDDANYFAGEDTDSDFFVYEVDGAIYDTQELLDRGYHFVNGEPILDPELAPTMKIVGEILKSPPMEMEEIEIRNPNWEG